MRRAVPVEVGPVDIEEVAQSFARTMAETGMAIAQEVCEELAESTQGLSLYGSACWLLRMAGSQKSGTDTVDKQRAQEGTLRARRRFDATVIEPVLQRLPGTANYLSFGYGFRWAKPSESGEVARRLGKTLQQVSTVRARLMRENVIESRSWGRVSFAIPHIPPLIGCAETVLGEYSCTLCAIMRTELKLQPRGLHATDRFQVRPTVAALAARPA